MSNRVINDWAPETRSLLRALVKAGCSIVSGDNGEYKFQYQSEDQFIRDLTACDESALHVNVPGHGGKVFWMSLVYGNEPGVLVSDYHCDPVLDAVVDAHYAEWSGRKQPTKEAA